MKVITILCQVGLAGCLLAVMMTPLSSEPRSQDLLTHPVHVNLEGVTTPDAVAQALLEARMPGGITALYYCGGFPTRSFKPSNSSLRAVLDAVVSSDPDYSWRLDDGAVNLVPRNIRINFLETHIPKLELKDVKTPDEALNKLMALPEVQRQWQSELGGRLVEGGAYAFGLNPTAGSEKTFSIALNNATVADALNAIAKAHGVAVWVLVKNECSYGGRKSFSIKFIHG